MKTRLSYVALCLTSLLAAVPACVDDAGDIEDGENDAATGKSDSVAEGSAEAAAILALVNDGTVDKAELDDDGGLSARVATNLTKHRDGADRTFGTADDDPFETLAEVDAIPYVGAAAMRQLLAYATAKGLLAATPRVDVIFSPQPAATAHTTRVARMIREARYSVDVAMYSYSDAEISTAIADAVARGVKVRFLFETARTDKALTNATDKANSKSGRLERAGVDVRWVNKILHHKFVIVDGPRDVATRAATAKIASGSANWSFGGAQTYDESTLFIDNSREMSQAYQREFDLLWNHSGDFSLATPIAQERSTTSFPTLTDDRGLEALFTTANFNPPTSGTTFRVDKTKTKVSDQLVAAIAGARTSIHIASGHLRLRPVAEALIAKRAASPGVDIKVYLDQQEYISTTGNNEQQARVTTCLAAAGPDVDAQRECTENDFLFGKNVGDAGIAVRYKSYAYRWDHSYAVQMHNKYFIIDGNELYSGSYNLSMNAEHATFENVIRLSGAAYAGVVAKFEANFAQLWETGRGSNLLTTLRNRIATSQSIPMVFDSMALTWQEFGDLKALIRANCSTADSADFRAHPGNHKVCNR